jgi:AmmeMemoRadiSam system protein A
MKINEKHKQKLLKLSRSALEHIFKTGNERVPKDSDMPKELKEVRATFVTLTKKGQLRGCIGKLYPVQEIYKDVVANTYAAAFEDIRFLQLQKEELKDLKIEISILNLPKELKYKDSKDLISKLNKDKPGIILEQGLRSATFLPQVWEELPKPEEFLSHLCQKAGLEPDIWKKEKLDIKTYNVTKFKEK